MKILELPVNKFYFTQVKNNELIEDFRAIKPYWIKKLIKKEYVHLEPIELVKSYLRGEELFRVFDEVEFKNGYSSESPKIRVKFESMRFTHPEEMTCMGKGIAFAIKIVY